VELKVPEETEMSISMHQRASAEKLRTRMREYEKLLYVLISRARARAERHTRKAVGETSRLTCALAHANVPREILFNGTRVDHPLAARY